MPTNKYNARAKRQELDSVIRDRSWNVFHTKFSQIAASQSISFSKKSQSDRLNGSLIQAIVECNNRNTTHRSLLHTLCAIPSSSSPPPANIISLVARFCPSAVYLHDSSSGGGGTPLHLAVGGGASVEVIKELIEASKFVQNYSLDMTRGQNLLESLDSKGNTPLLSAVKAGGFISEDVVKYLVDEDLNDSGGLSLLWSSAGGKKKKNKHHAPLSVPLKYVASHESAFVGQGLESRHDLLRFMIVRTYHAVIKSMNESISQKKNENVQNEERNTIASSCCGGKKENKAVVVVERGVCLLQAAITCHNLFGSSKIASSIISYIIRHKLYLAERLRGSQQQLQQDPWLLNTTLHSACSVPNIKKFDQLLRLGENRVTDYGIDAEDCTLMEYLVKNTSSTSVAISTTTCSAPAVAPSNLFLCRNFEGHLPLHCAIQSGKEWSQIQLLVDACPSSVREFTSKGFELPLHLAIKQLAPMTTIINLWKLYPEAALLKDGPSGLYPFQMAALMEDNCNMVATNSSKRSKKSPTTTLNHEFGLDGLELSFFFLREYPALISSFLQPTPEDKYQCQS